MALREHTEGEAQGARQLGRSKEDYGTYTHADALRALARRLEMAETDLKTRAAINRRRTSANLHTVLLRGSKTFENLMEFRCN
ncbi:MAG: hypothetical protein WB679_02360 [Terracidiphilus sp.]